MMKDHRRSSRLRWWRLAMSFYQLEYYGLVECDEFRCHRVHYCVERHLSLFVGRGPLPTPYVVVNQQFKTAVFDCDGPR